MILGHGMKFDEIEIYLDHKLFINNNPVWDYKLSGYILELIAFDSGDEVETVTVEEIIEYLENEEVDTSEVLLVNEDTQKDIVNYKNKYKTIFLSDLILK
mgnify:CR=1 FL=1|tara:strand:- start:645 stop:944 length:300 start_codon:yes stop_codon:yes gene_type:complete